MKNSSHTRADRQILVLVVSDNHIIRSGLLLILDSETGIQVFGDASIEQAVAVEIMPGQYPDLILVDLDSRGNDALRFIENLLHVIKIDSSVLVLSDLIDHEL